MRDPYSTPEQPDAADPNWRHPVEDIEPIPEGEGYRMAARKLSVVLNKALIFILDASDKRLAAWQVAYAIGLPVCEGVSMTERSELLGSATCPHCAKEIGGDVTRAAFSKGAKAFLRAAHLPTSEHMKSEEATGAYARARELQLQSP